LIRSVRADPADKNLRRFYSLPLARCPLRSEPYGLILVGDSQQARGDAAAIALQSQFSARRVQKEAGTGPGLLAHVLVAKYADHLPLNRQAEIYRREGVELDRSTLADWLGGASRTLQPLLDALRKYVLVAQKLHGDDVPVPVLEPGNGKTKTGRLWTYVRDDRPSGSEEPAAVWFATRRTQKGSIRPDIWRYTNRKPPYYYSATHK
jgi:hypothetical protein